jgi:hypothetical protein
VTRSTLVLCAALAACSAEEPSADQDLATAFVWGYPLVVSARTVQTLARLVGANTLFNQTAPLGASASFIVSPNQDTFYSVAALDLRNGPVVLTVPDVTDRYWTYQFLDAWTNSFHYVGTRTTGGSGGTFVIAPPGWNGDVPAGAELVSSPTPRAFLLGRYVVGDEADMDVVNALERTLVPLDPAAAAPDPGPPPGAPADTGSDGAAFFDELGDALAIDPPATDADAAALQRFAGLGIGPGLHPSAEIGADAVAAGLARIDEATLVTGHRRNGWTTYLDIDAFEADPLERAVMAKTLWGANVPAEAVYARSRADSDGTPYDGTRPHLLRFDTLPPVDPDHGFWSVTLYGPDGFFVPNALDRYAISDRTPGIVVGPDGSLELFIQSAPPSSGESNWLPAPAGPYEIVLRLYLPGAEVLDGAYVCPAVTAL